MGFAVRKATKSDIPAIFQMVKVSLKFNRIFSLDFIEWSQMLCCQIIVSQSAKIEHLSTEWCESSKTILRIVSEYYGFVKCCAHVLYFSRAKRWITSWFSVVLAAKLCACLNFCLSKKRNCHHLTLSCDCGLTQTFILLPTHLLRWING